MKFAELKQNIAPFMSPCHANENKFEKLYLSLGVFFKENFA